LLTKKTVVDDFESSFGEAAALSNAQSQELFDSIDMEQDAQLLDDCDILTFFRSDCNAMPARERNRTGVSSWGGRYSIFLYNIPWFRFQEMIGMDPPADQILHSVSSLHSPHRPPDNLALDDRRKALYGLLGLHSTVDESEIVPKLTSMMQILVPERFDGDVLQKLQQLLNPSSSCSTLQIAEFALCFVSNNTLTMEGTGQFLKWIMKDELKEFFRLLFQMRTLTVQAVSTKLLESTARFGNASILQFLIDTGIDRSGLSGIKGGRLLQLALFCRHMGVAQILLQAGADVNPQLNDKRWPFSQPPLHLAVINGNADMTRHLLNVGAWVDRYADHTTALSVAVSKRTPECIRLLLEAGADVDNCNVDEENALDWAFLNGEMVIYHMLLSSSQKPKTSLTLSGILCAAKEGVRTLSKYLESKKDVDDFSQRITLESALCEATKYSSHAGAVKALLGFGVDPNVKTIEGDKACPLVEAVICDDINLAALLLDAGADIDAPGVLAIAAEDEYRFEFLNFLIEQGADIESFGANALAQAAIWGNFAAAKLLLRSGVDVNEPDNDGYFPLQRAARRGDSKVVEFLVREGANVNAPPSLKEGYTALHFAVGGENVNLIRFLIQEGAHISTQPHPSLGKTLLEACATGGCGGFSRNRSEIFKLLLNVGAPIAGPQVRRRCRDWNSALTSLITRSAENELVQLVLDAGADINQPGCGKGARTPIQAAAEVGNLDLIKQLLLKGAKINAPAAALNGRTALQAGCSRGRANLELIEVLLGNGADVNAEAGIYGGLTALQGAAIGGHIKIVLLLLDAGADVNADSAEKDGRMALDGAAEHGRLDMVQLLLNANAKSEGEGKSGYDTAVELAEENGHFAVAELLKSHSEGIRS
jgi:ankyrin repeat protein